MASSDPAPTNPLPAGNPLRAYFDAIVTGPGIWKWEHYFEIYHRHLARFIGTEVSVLEVGVYSGGSLRMWRDYFGERCQLHGVDVQEACKVYETTGTRIHIGNQGDRGFWKQVRETVPKLDVLIDDGSHDPEHQRITLEEMLPHLSRGGVYLCEDIHYESNPFSAWVHKMADKLNAFAGAEGPAELTSEANPLQSMIHSFHFYPYVAVIEKHAAPCDGFVAPKRGTEWQPFF